MREAERLGKLHSRVRSTYASFDMVKKASEDVPLETFRFSEKDDEIKKSEDISYEKVEDSSKESEEKCQTLVENTTADIKLRSIFDSSPSAIIVTDLHGNITECNPAFIELHGFSNKEEIIGKNFIDFIAPEDQHIIAEALEKTLGGDSVKNIEYNSLGKNGRKFLAEFFVSILPDVTGRPAGFVALTMDITERKQAEDELKKSKRKIELQNIKLKKLDELKSNFLNVTSHELRTPITPIKGYLQLLMKQKIGNITEEQKKGLEVILRNTNRLDHLIQDILDISRLESRTMKFIPEKTDVKRMVEETVETMQSSADLKDIKINVELEDKVPDLVIDQDRIKQVIMNLVNNAIKFSPDGSIINVRARKENNDVFFEVQDFGRGIPKDKQENIFETFYQVDSGKDKKFGGVGLGLSISQGIVLAHGGQIQVDSAVGEGSTFRFSLPIEAVVNMEEKFKSLDIFGLESIK